MRRIARASWWISLVCLAACAAKPPPAARMSLKVPPPPDAVPGTIRIYGDSLSEARENEIRDRLRAADPKVLGAFESFTTSDPSLAHSGLNEGRLQLRLGINKDGKVASVVNVYSEVRESLVGEVARVLGDVTFPPGPEAWAFSTFQFEENALEVLKVHPEFNEHPPVLVAIVENRSTFHLPAVSATVTVLGPEKSKPLRVFRRRVNDAFSPGDRHELRIPIGAEWATARNSFLVVVRPALEKPTKEN
ncbi:MAG TPA: hypothetical protein VMR29_02470 [Candidatus Binatia bacterium]|nr:hypothetical protein [Candidatus Binatia bacterium]